jgi:hypothetical protein
MKTLPDSPTEPVDPRQRVQQAALEINRLHAEVVRLTTESKQSLASAVAVAWQAGHLLLAEKKRVRQTCGAAWLLWLEHNFKGVPRTAQRYMWLAQSEPDVSQLQGLSLRQAYFRLGLATEHKSPAENRQVRSFPQHILLTGKLLVALPSCDDVRRLPPEQREAYRQDLRPLYQRLRPLFETDTAGAMAARLTAGH